MSTAALAPGAAQAQNVWQRLREYILPLSAIGIVFVMLVPLPAAALDFLLAISMAASIIVFLSAVQIRRAVELSVFPTLLLLLTLFRLALNIASISPPSWGFSFLPFISPTSTAGDIGNDLTSFFGSFASLEANPSNDSLREEVLSSATTLAGDVSNAAASLNTQSAALSQEASGVTSQVNALTGAIAQLNEQIETTSPNADAGTLADQRNQDISQLSQLIGINRVTAENNGLSITTASGGLLVSGATTFPLSSGPIAGVTHFFLGTEDITAQLSSGGGQLGGYLTARDQDIPAALNTLDQLAYAVSTGVNALNNTGTDLAGATGTPASPLYIFSQPAQAAGSALSMSVVMTDPGQIAAAGLGLGVGDSSNAVAMAALANQAIVGGQTPTNYFSNFASTLGATVSGVQAENTAQTASVSQLQTQSNALSEVNLNDEAGALSTLQSSYQAASQVFSILNTIMASALNLGEETTVS